MHCLNCPRLIEENEGWLSCRDCKCATHLRCLTTRTLKSVGKNRWMCKSCFKAKPLKHKKKSIDSPLNILQQAILQIVNSQKSIFQDIKKLEKRAEDAEQQVRANSVEIIIQEPSLSFQTICNSIGYIFKDENISHSYILNSDGCSVVEFVRKIDKNALIKTFLDKQHLFKGMQVYIQSHLSMNQRKLLMDAAVVAQSLGYSLAVKDNKIYLKKKKKAAPVLIENFDNLKNLFKK